MRTTDPPDPSAIEHAASLVTQADALIIAAGAGMGVDSGLPDFRGKDGFWRAYPALAAAKIDFYSSASPEAFRTSPERAWGFYGHRQALFSRRWTNNTGCCATRRRRVRAAVAWHAPMC